MGLEKILKKAIFVIRTYLYKVIKVNNNDWHLAKIRSKYVGKKFSILGDSISTLNGYNPIDYNVFYKDLNCKKFGVSEISDTWWGKVINYFDGDLLVNNSWSGSRVTRLPNEEALFPSGCSDERTSNLHMNSIKPDVIFVNLGINDWANGVKVYSDETRLLIPYYTDCFSEAYELMIQKLKDNYPNSEIWCFTLAETVISKMPDFKFPHSYNGIDIQKYNVEICRIANEYRCKIVHLKTPYDSIDGIHPNEAGMNTIALQTIKEMNNETE